MTTDRTPLAVYRYAAGLGQREVAERAGISRLSVINLELGKHRPRLLTALALSDVLRVPVEDLFPEGTYGGGPLGRSRES